ncbi:MAG: hypothetical protein H0X24_15240 [Ktedonobacterales bacterium]|nr:hypothetical protein [Ktedonobacterales bacterium]
MRRTLRLMGPQRLERMGQRSAIKAARYAYAHVPFYRTLYERHAFDAARMQRLTWAEFQQLPTVSKADVLDIADDQLVDQRLNVPGADAHMGRSSGTTTDPITWPVGWSEFYTQRTYLKNTLRDLGSDTHRTAVVCLTPVDGSDVFGNLLYRLFFSIKEETQWPFEIFTAGEDLPTADSILRYIVRQGYHTFWLTGLPGTMQHLLDYQAERAQSDPANAMQWDQLPQKMIWLAGQIVPLTLQARIRRDLRMPADDLKGIQVMFGSSDSGQLIAQSTPFTVWLQRYAAEHLTLTTHLEQHLGITAEHRDKPLLQFVPALSVQLENDPEVGLLLTTWKHRPLVRYRSNDFALYWPGRSLIALLDQHAPAWRADFARYGYGPQALPTNMMLGMVLGRADDVRIVNGENITPDVLREALAAANILPYIRHFKHDTDDALPNDYFVYIELPRGADPAECAALAAQWRQPLLDALVRQPNARDFYAAHTPGFIDLHLAVRARGTEEFAGSDQRGKIKYTLRRTKETPVVAD